jgi:hypothetical protein
MSSTTSHSLWDLGSLWMLLKGPEYNLYAPNCEDAFSSLVPEKSFGKTCLHKHKTMNSRQSID